MKGLRLLTDNLFLKLFALGAAVLLYMFVNSQIDQPIDLEYPVEYRTAEDVVVINDPPKRVSVTLVGPWANLRSLVWSQREAIIVDLSRRGPGEERVHLDAFDVHAPEGMTVADVSPTLIDVALDRRIEKMVLVEPDLTGRPPFGYELGEVRIDPPRVRVAGPRSRIQLIDRIYTRSVDLEGKTAELQVTVPLRPPAQLSELVDRTSVGLLIAIREEMIERRVKDVEVKALGADGLVKVVPARVSFAVHGPRRVLESLDTAQLQAVVQVAADAQPGDRLSMPIEVRPLPERVAVLGDLPTVEVQVRRKKP